jgi:hypothetical protein
MVLLNSEASDVCEHRCVRFDAVRLSPLSALVGVRRVLVGRDAVGNQRRVRVTIQPLDARSNLFGNSNGHNLAESIPKRQRPHNRRRAEPEIFLRQVVYRVEPRRSTVANHQRIGVVQRKQMRMHYCRTVLPKQRVELAQYLETHLVPLA